MKLQQVIETLIKLIEDPRIIVAIISAVSKLIVVLIEKEGNEPSPSRPNRSVKRINILLSGILMGMGFIIIVDEIMESGRLIDLRAVLGFCFFLLGYFMLVLCDK